MDINECLSEFQIIGSRITKLNIINDFILFDNDQNAERKLDLSHEVNEVVQDEDGKSHGVVSLYIDVEVLDGQKEYRLNLGIEGCFECGAETGEDTFTKMLEINGITTLYSIARAFVLSVTPQTLVDGSIVLPMINVFSYSKNLADAETEQEATKEDERED